MDKIKITFLLMSIIIMPLHADKINRMYIDEAASDNNRIIIDAGTEHCGLYAISQSGKWILGDKNSDCIYMTNSKKINIVCTPKKKVCKTEDEIIDFLGARIGQQNTNMNISEHKYSCEEIGFHEFRHTNPYMLKGKCTVQGFYIVSIMDRNTAFGYHTFMSYSQYHQYYNDMEQNKPVVITAKDNLSQYFSEGTMIQGKFKITGVTKVTLVSGEEKAAIELEWIQKN